MALEKSAGAVIFRRKQGNIYYLVLHYHLGHWGFPKGHLEKSENWQEAAERETEEETGLSGLKFIDGFKEWFKYFFRRDDKSIAKIVTYFLAEASKAKIVISSEHLSYRWLPYKQAVKQLTFQNDKDVLRKANNFLR